MGTEGAGRRERFSAIDTRAAATLANVALLFGAPGICEAETVMNVITVVAEQRHAFDFLIGTWKVHHYRLKVRLAHSDEWEDFEGTSRCWAVLGGDGNVDDNVIALPSGTYRAATMRVFDSQTGLWRIWWFDARNSEALDPPLIGSFLEGSGTFYASDHWQGRPIRVRFLWNRLDGNSARWEQAFSDDDGKTWETNWVMSFERQQR